MKLRIFATALLLATGWTAAQDKPKGHEEAKRAIESKVRTERQEITAAHRAETVQEALEAVLETQAALVALEQGKKEEGLAHLGVATGKLALLIARYPDLRMLPIESEAEVVDFQGDLPTIRTLVERARKALGENKIQEARRLLLHLASELRITTTHLPLAVYPGALKKVAPLIDQGKLEEAKQAILDTLNTLVVTEKVFPLPVLRATAMVERAQRLAEEKEKEKALQFLESAKYQLQLAEALGYGEVEKDYRPLYGQIARLEEELEGDRWQEGFVKLRSALKALTERLTRPRELQE